MGSAEVEAFLSHLATERHVAPSTHKQALAALLFLYRQVLDIELPWMQQIGRPKSPVQFRSCYRTVITIAGGASAYRAAINSAR